MSRAVQGKLPHLQPGRQQTTMKETEAGIQATIVDGLTRLGYIVLKTQHQYRFQSCPKCLSQFRPRGGYGADKGVPDLLVTHAAWTNGEWFGLEVKGPATAVSDAQQALLQTRRIVVVRSWDEAREAVEKFDNIVWRDRDEGHETQTA